MRRPILLASSLAVLASLACGKATKPPASVSPAVDVAQLTGPEVVPDAPSFENVAEANAAFDGTNYLVVWTRRTAAGDDVYGTRVSASGEILDPAGFVISGAASNQRAPTVAFDGTNYMVAWQDHRSTSGTIYAARVTPSGAVLDPNGFPIDVQAALQRTPVIGFDGTNHLVVWTDRRGGLQWDVYGARVTPGGVVLDRAFIVAAVQNQQFTPAMAFDGTNFLVVWSDRRAGSEIFGARVTPAGVVLDPAGIAISPGGNVGSPPAAAFDGTNVVVTWADLRNGLQPDIYAARVAPSGAVLDPSGIAVASGTVEQRLPAIAADGRYLLGAWVKGDALAPTDVQAVRLDVSGTVLDSPAFPIAEAAAARSVALASDGAGRVLSLYDVVDALGVAHLRARVVTNWAMLDVAKAGRGAGTVSSNPDGIDCGGTCSAPFDGGTVVTLTAEPNGDSVFAGWSGACAGTDPCAVTVDQARSVTATFLPLHAVTVAIAPGGPGSVTSVPAGIECGGGASACSVRFVEGTQLQLVQHPVRGASVFGSWSGDCSGSETCSLTVDGPKSVTATFLPAVTITFGPTGTGAGAVEAGGVSCSAGSCTLDVAKGTTLPLTASPDASSVLKTWTGCTSWSETSCSVAVTTSPRTVSARFEPKALTVTATTTGSGAGTISGAGLACTTGASQGCTAEVGNPAFTTSYSVVTLRATPSPGSVFKSWSGCAAVVGDPSACTLTVNGPESVSAKFETSTLALNATTTGTGAGTISGAGLACTTGSPTGCTAAVPNPPDSTTYTMVTLRATPLQGSVFKSWSGCAAVVGDPASCTVTVSATKTVSAKFETSTIPLSAGSTGTGAGTISGAGLDCTTGSTAGCTAAVPNPPDSAGYTTVTLRATPLPGSVFKSWTGCTAVVGDAAACTLTVGVAKTVTARFETDTVPIYGVTTGNGAGAITGAGLQCTTGSSAGCTGAAPNPDNTSAYATVTLRATPLEGSVFKSWSGCTAVAGDPAACTVVATPGKTVTAKFETSAIPLSASTTGTGSGTITGAGLQCSTGSSAGCTAAVPNPPETATYTTVTLRATPLEGSVFKSWSGCTAVAGDPAACTVTVNTAKSVSAKFEPNTLPLTASTTGTGAGTITGPGLECTTGSPDGCTTVVSNPGNTTAYTTVTLRATPLEGSIFKSWSGCTAVVGDPAACNVTVNMAKSVLARFEPSTYALGVIISGVGGVTGGGIACTSESPEGCSVPVANGATVDLTATPGTGYMFKSWSGCTSTSGSTCRVTMTAAKNVTATFQPATYPLEISFPGLGAGTVTAGTETCASSSGTCTLAEPNGAVLYLTATPDPGSTFTGWAGACTGTASCRVTMTAARSVAATFTPSP